jgi:hypothetical protein
MAVESAPPGAMQFPVGAQVTEVTLSPTALCHYITDSELERIGDVGDNLPMQVCIGSAGTLAGSVVSTFIAFSHVGDPSVVFSKTDMASVCVTLISLGLGVFSGAQWFRLETRRTPLINEIRARPKVALMTQ